MKYLLTILIFFITSCSPPEPLTDAWFKQKHKELLDSNAEICIMARNQNPNNEDYIFD